MRVLKTAIAVSVACLVTAAVAAVAGAAATSPDPPACAARWTLLPASAVPRYAAMASVTGLSRRDGWFAGNSGAYGIGAGAWHWDGRSVAATRPQIPALPLASAVWGIDQDGGPGSFDSSRDGWVLATPGDLMFTGLASFATAEHWHDGQWIMTPLAVSPDAAAIGVEVYDISALSPASAWAVGGFYQAGPGVAAGAHPIGALIEHWDGTAWTIVANPASARPDGTLYGLTAVSPGDIWAVGYQAGTTRGSIVPLVEHWNGARWSVARAPVGSQPSALYSISADRRGGVWAAGDQTWRGTAHTAVPLIDHWDGTSWSAQRLPRVGNSRLGAIYAASPDDVWAGGIFAQGLTNAFLHWDGHAWTAVPIPGPQEYGLSYQVNAIGGTGPDDVWAAGSANGSTLIAHLSCGRRHGSVG